MPFSGLPPNTPFGPDWELKALIARNQYANFVSADATRLLAEFYTTLRDRLESGIDFTDWQRTQLQALVNWAAQRLGEVVGGIQFGAERAIAAAGPIEQKAQYGQAEDLRGVLGLPSRSQLIQAARFTEIVQNADIGGVTLGKWWQRDATNALARMQRTVKVGLLQGLGPREIARLAINADPSVRTLFSDQTAGVRTAIRTAMTAVNTQAALLEQKEMADVIHSVLFSAVIDARTSEICSHLNNTTYKLNDPKTPHPPLHPNCRSSLVPVPDLSALGLPQSKLGKPVSYDTWLRGQSLAVKKDVLGVANGTAFHENKLDLGDIISSDGKKIPLSQLSARLAA